MVEKGEQVGGCFSGEGLGVGRERGGAGAEEPGQVQRYQGREDGEEAAEGQEVDA
ncbi:hypothetical protein GCM10009850_081130 [Nonomuraea monospora]|uniref:Uncharacterized protein n=1 Tax=Nonomuraea monospora TaxID=568818 RepID=A0ABP5PLS3_9ACTN